MRLLVVSFYYSPDLAAGSFRATALVTALRERAPPGTHIDVVTTLPNRYRTFARVAAETESSAHLDIRRIGLPAHRSDMLGQARAFIHFARAALRHVAKRDYDLVFATSSRLMTAALGALIARRKRARLYLDIRDIFVDTIGDVLPQPLAWPLRQLLAPIERWTIRRADRVISCRAGSRSTFEHGIRIAASRGSRTASTTNSSCPVPPSRRRPERAMRA